MKDSTTLLVLVLFLFLMSSSTVLPGSSSYAPGPAAGPPQPPLPGTPTHVNNVPNPLRQVENAVSPYGVPVAAVGTLAQSAPTWFKLAVFPVGVTSVVQGFINSPKNEIKSIGSDVGGAASTAASAVGGAAKKVWSWL